MLASRALALVAVLDAPNSKLPLFKLNELKTTAMTSGFRHHGTLNDPIRNGYCSTE